MQCVRPVQLTAWPKHEESVVAKIGHPFKVVPGLAGEGLQRGPARATAQPDEHLPAAKWGAAAAISEQPLPAAPKRLRAVSVARATQRFS